LKDGKQFYTIERLIEPKEIDYNSLQEFPGLLATITGGFEPTKSFPAVFVH
jgi:hypothetical protein